MKQEVKKAKRKFERKLAKQAQKTPKQFYSYLKKTTSNRVSVGPVIGDAGMVTDSKEMAEMLNDQYCSVFTSVCQGGGNTTSTTVQLGAVSTLVEMVTMFTSARAALHKNRGADG